MKELKQLKILAIGNSFSEDGMEYLYEIAKDYGLQTIVLGNLYIGGASLQDHINQIDNNRSDYTYFKNTTNKWVGTSNVNILTGLQDEPWDIITIQQASHYSGILESYDPFLEQLIQYVNTNKKNPNAKLVWHMTWAYQKDSDHEGFARYNNDQTTMYNRIVDVVQTRIVPSKEFLDIIPTGIAIQNLRTTTIGDTLTRDGFHLSFDKGRYCASLCWFHTLTRYPIDRIVFKPKGVTKQEQKLIIEAVKQAVVNNFV